LARTPLRDDDPAKVGSYRLTARLGAVHRDLKPSNVLLTASGPKVIDFGIAQVLEATAVTKAGFTVGSAGFMAPEQITGRGGTAADLFSWAVTIAYAASGRPPFGTGTSEVILYRILHEKPDLAAVPSSLLPQVTEALAKEPQARPTAPELLSQLTHTAAQPSAGYDNPTQTILAQTWLTPASRPQVPTPPPQVPARPPEVPARSLEVPYARRSGPRRPALPARARTHRRPLQVPRALQAPQVPQVHRALQAPPRALQAPPRALQAPR
jgi:serine/threonine protein kinase